MKKLLTLAAVAAGVTVAGATYASGAPVMMTGMTAPWYVGVGVNYSANMTDKLTGQDASGDAVDFKLNDNGAGGNIFVGYLVNQYFGTELGFSYVGEDKYKGTIDGTASTSVKIKDQYNLHFVGNAYLPVTTWFQPYVFGGVGYINGKVDFAANTDTAKFSGFGLVYGAGLQFMIQQFGIRVNYTRLDTNAISTDTATVGVPNPKDYISLDVLYRFGA